MTHMRIAVVSDIHGYRTALQAVIADLRGVAPDLILNGGDVADTGSSPVEVLDYIQESGWPGVMGNTDEILVRPESLENFASQSSAPAAMWSAIRDMASYTRHRLGPERLAWLRTMQRRTFKRRWRWCMQARVILGELRVKMRPTPS